MGERRGFYLKSKNVRDLKFLGIFEKVQNFDDLASHEKITVTKDIIRQRALLFRDEYCRKANYLLFSMSSDFFRVVFKAFETECDDGNQSVW